MDGGTLPRPLHQVTKRSTFGDRWRRGIFDAGWVRIPRSTVEIDGQQRARPGCARRLSEGANRYGALGINGCIVSRMPKMQVYLPDELYEKIKSQTARLNVSGILQDALAQRHDQLERQDALAAAVDSYTAEFGVFSDEELNRQAEADRKQTVRP